MIKKIAERVGVSTSAVRRALKGFPDISKETRERVEQAAKELNYRPNFLAGAMKTKRTMLIGVVVPELASGFFPEIVDGIEDSAARNGYRILVSKHDYQDEKLRQAVEMYSRYQVDGLILAPSGYRMSPELINEINCFQSPMVMIDDDVDRAGLTKRFAWVGVDDARLGAEVAGYLVGRGHRRFAFAGMDDGKSSIFKRCEGLRQGLARLGVNLDDTMVRHGGIDEESGRRIGLELLASGELPDVIVCAVDTVAMGLMLALLEKGVDIPGRVSVMGIGNLGFSHALPVPLTTVDQFPRQTGMMALEQVVARIGGTGEGADAVLLMETKVVERLSVAVLAPKSARRGKSSKNNFQRLTPDFQHH